MSVKRKGEKSVLSKQDIAQRRKQLTQKKMQHGGTGRRAIVGVAVLAASVLSLLAVASFDARDRIGPGFKNAIGPVGHAIAEALRGLLGVCAFVLPVVGLYAAGILFVGDREKKRWPQAVALGLLLVAGAILAQLMFKEDASWAHAPGGLIGRELGGALTALFSTVGTVVLVSAGAAVAFIVGTQFAFLRFCAWAWEKALVGVGSVGWRRSASDQALARRRSPDSSASGSPFEAGCRGAGGQRSPSPVAAAGAAPKRGVHARPASTRKAGVPGAPPKPGPPSTESSSSSSTR